MADGLDWLASNMSVVRALCRRSAGKRPDLQDELFGDLVDRVNTVYARFRGTGSIDAYMIATLHRYAVKAARRLRTGPYTHHEVPVVDKREQASRQAAAILEELCWLDRLFLLLHVKYRMSFEEIAVELGTSKAEAYRYYQSIVSRTRVRHERIPCRRSN